MRQKGQPTISQTGQPNGRSGRLMMRQSGQPTPHGGQPSTSTTTLSSVERDHSAKVYQKQSLSNGNCQRRRSRSVDELRDFNTVCKYGRHPVDSSIVVPRFNGTEDLELFLKRFMSVARYYNWTEEEILFRLEHSIVDNAQYVMLDMPSVGSVDEFVTILRSRFGIAASAEQYRVELGRLRRGTMSLQELHLEVRRLVNKAFPGQWSKSTEIYARDAFLTALDDSEMRRRIIMAIPPPETLSAAYDLAMRAITVDDAGMRAGRCDVLSPNYSASRKPGSRARLLAEDEKSTEKEVQQQATIEELRKQVAELKSAMSTLVESQKQLVASAVTGRAEVSQPKWRTRQPEAVCWNCNQPGHWAKKCPIAKSKSQQKTVAEGAAKASMLSGKRRPKVKVYMDIIYRGQKYKALLDTGCDISVVSSRVLPGLSYQEENQRMFAANLFSGADSRNSNSVFFSWRSGDASYIFGERRRGRDSFSDLIG
jgi:hypothetical protein